MSGAGQALYERARKRIPGGTQLLSKRPEMFLPGGWPSYYREARGTLVWDLDGNQYIDMSHNGIGACVLGAADPDVNEAVKLAIERGSMATLNCPEEVELADLLCEIHPWAEMVRYARTGGEAMAIAVRIARAHTRRERIAFCGYHGWHDWYLAANLPGEDRLEGHLLAGLDPLGVPRGLTDTAFPFHYNQVEELEEIASKHGDALAAIVMEPIRSEEPHPGFLERVKEISRETRAILIFDEISSGFRLNSGGAHRVFGVEPDIAVFAKAISNGYPMAAVIGTAPVMQASQCTFISSTYWTERIGPAAALATIRKHQRYRVGEHLIAIGRLVQAGWKAAAESANLSVAVGGIPPLSHFAIAGPEGQAAHTLFTQWMLERGFLAGKAFYATFAHTEEQVNQYLAAAREIFTIIGQELARGTVASRLQGPVAHSGFTRLT